MTIGRDQTFITQLPGGGYQLLLLWKDAVSSQEPVLGFLVYEIPTDDKQNKFHWIYPATFDQVYDGDGQDHVLLAPDGKVYEPHGRIFSSRTEFEAYLKAKRTTPPQSTDANQRHLAAITGEGGDVCRLEEDPEGAPIYRRIKVE